MSQCINPFCYHKNPDDLEVCEECETPLIFDRYFRATGIIRESIGYQSGIYEAIDIRDGSAKILKVLSGYGTPKKLIQLFQRQFWILARYKHPQIPTVAEYFEIVLPHPNEGVKIYGLLMNKIEGITLKEWLSQGNKLNIELALNWYEQLCQILQYLHSNSLIHRDIKPSNIMLKEDGQLVLIDFGTIRNVSSTTYLVKLNTRVGDEELPGLDDITAFISKGYSPKEQVRGKSITQSDFFALGRTFVHLLTGVHPNRIESIGDRINWRPLAAHIDKLLLDFTDELIEPVPQKRPKSIEDIVFKLSGLPARINLYKKATSWYAQTFIGLMSFLVVFGFYKAFSSYQANRFLNEGNKYLLENSEYQVDFAKAKNKFEQGLRYEPQNTSLINNLAFSCAGLKDNDCAFKNYKKAIEIKNTWSAYYNFAGYYQDIQDYKSARKYLNLAIKVSDGKVADPYVNLSYLMILNKEYKSALDLIRQGLKIDSNVKAKSAFLKNKGWIYFLQGDYVNAEQYLLDSLKLDTSLVSTYCIMAKTQEALSKPAIQWWASCLRFNRSDASSREVQQWRSEILIRASQNSPFIKK